MIGRKIADIALIQTVEVSSLGICCDLLPSEPSLNLLQRRRLSFRAESICAYGFSPLQGARTDEKVGREWSIL